MRTRIDLALGAAVALALGAAGDGAAADDLAEAIAESQPILHSRLRYEFVDQDGFAEDADAVTVSTKLGVETGEFHGLRLLVEAEDVTALSDDYNSTTNGETAFPVVADPEGTEINRAQIAYSGVADTQIVLGRQRIALNNHRFVGNVGFRQNEQTFDALSVTNTSIENVTVRYAYLDGVRRVFGADHPLGEFDSRSHVIDVDAETPVGALAAYGLLLDFDNAPAASSQTFGARLSGALPTLGETSLRYVAELAQQSDYADNPADFNLSYVHGEIGASRDRFSGALGGEWLEGDGATGFSTPLATLHKFQGWADAFLATPSDGIRDLYASGGATWDAPPLGESLRASVVVHDFASDDGDLDFGHEVDAVAHLTLNEHFSFELKAAGFSGGSAGPADRTKLWAGVSVGF